MADLSNLLGAVYGENSPQKSGEDHTPERDPDGPPTPVEKAADERTPAPPLADDLAAALSEALVAQEAKDVDEDGEDAATDDARQHHSGPQLSPERAAAVELMHASRPDSEPLGLRSPLMPLEDSDDEHEDEVQDHDHGMGDPEPAPMAPVAPMAPIEPIAIDDLPYVNEDRTPAPKPVAAPVAMAPEPAESMAEPPVVVGSRRWDRSDDDILPGKGGSGGKKFFSLSLRRG